MHKENLVPHQVQQIINDLLNNRDSVHLRGNYKLRLVAIKDAIDGALRKYETEVIMAEPLKEKKKR
jgi:hypothetical protein